MRALRLVALSDDGKSLVLSTDGPDGEERFELPIDERVRAAARGDARLGAIEDLGNTLPPRVIQARIRAGETPEQVALASGTRIDRIMRFAHPVLQERGRIAEQSLQARVRLSEGVPAGTLEQFMGERLRLLGADLDVVRWDAARSADGTWTVSGAWSAGANSGVARWSFDIPAREVAPLDAATRDFAEGTRLVRVVPDVPDVPGGSAPVPRQPSGARPEEPAESRPRSRCPTPRPGRRPDRPPRRRPTSTSRSTRTSASTTPSSSAAPTTTPTTPAPGSRRGRTSSSASAATADPTAAGTVRVPSKTNLVEAPHTHSHGHCLDASVTVSAEGIIEDNYKSHEQVNSAVRRRRVSNTWLWIVRLRQPIVLQRSSVRARFARSAYWRLC